MKIQTLEQEPKNTNSIIYQKKLQNGPETVWGELNERLYSGSSTV